MNSFKSENGSGLVILPAVLAMAYPLWSSLFRESLWLAMVPQAAAYCCLAAWLTINDRRLDRLYLRPFRFKQQIFPGAVVGLITAGFNLWVIVKLTPWMGYRFDFLRETPHAQMPFALMVPWGIFLIALLVELNFRGFLLGRLITLFGTRWYAKGLAVLISAWVFSWDPFMVTVFRGYHWLAFSDGLIWGVLLLWTRSLYSTITAHTIEVILVYSILRVFYA